MTDARDRDRDRESRTRAQRLEAHAAECDECRAQPLPLNSVATLLSGYSVNIDDPALSQRTMTQLRPQLERLAQRALWRRIAACVLVSLLPLPLVLAYDAYVLRVAYDLVSALLPINVAAYLVLSYAAFLLFLFALTYAAIPVLVARDAKAPLSTAS